MSEQANNYLLVIGDREPLAWILTTGQMAFSGDRFKSTSQLRTGDRILIYTTRGCFRNHGRDRGWVMGRALVTIPTRHLDEPVVFGDRSFPVGCGLRIEALAGYGQGIELGRYVDRLHAFPNPQTWPYRIRRALAPLDDHDYDLLSAELESHFAADLDEVIADYVRRAHPPAGHPSEPAR